MEPKETTKTGAPSDNPIPNIYPSTNSFPDNPPPYSSISKETPTAPTVDASAAPQQTFTHANAATTFVPVIVTQQVGPESASVVCQSCHEQTTTRVQKKPSMKTHLFALVLCVVGCWPLACLPYCMDTCMNSDHYCSNCDAFIGSYISN